VAGLGIGDTGCGVVQAPESQTRPLPARPPWKRRFFNLKCFHRSKAWHRWSDRVIPGKGFQGSRTRSPDKVLLHSRVTHSRFSREGLLRRSLPTWRRNRTRELHQLNYLQHNSSFAAMFASLLYAPCNISSRLRLAASHSFRRHRQSGSAFRSLTSGRMYRSRRPLMRHGPT
jgi:hypothetical protein